MTEQSLKGKTAIVTGASKGIGAGIALELGKRGANVLLTYTSASSEAKVNDLVAQISAFPSAPKAQGIAADLRSPDAPKKIVSAALSLSPNKKISILVNNAGFQKTKPLAELTAEDFTETYSLNVLAVILLTKAILPHLDTKSRIINIGSVGGRAGFPELSLYCSSKAALEGLTRSWAAELGPDGHTVNCVNPGPVQTELLEGVPSAIIEKQKESTPAEKRMGTVEDIAGVVGFLAEGDRSRWITGQVISASGGWAMY